MSEGFVDIDGVRITPPTIEFSESIHPKKYHSRFTLQNVGKNKAFIRIPRTDTKNFEIDFLPEGMHLSAGLKIIRTVKLNYSKECARECLIRIQINDRIYDYLIILKATVTTILVEPKFLDFGLLNAGNIHMSQLLVIENKSDKDHQFLVDVTKCSENVVVEPIRGKIKAQGICEIGVKLIGFAETTIDSQFLIKCAQQIIYVPIKGKIIISKLEVLHPNATQHFTLLEFPPTYFGLSSEVHLFIRNYSAIAYMFATMAEVHQKRVSISEMKEKSINFKFFNTFPTDGVFHSNETKLFKFTFSPVDTAPNYSSFFFCTILMHRFKCTSLNKENVIDFDFDLISYFSQGRTPSYDPSVKSSETNIYELLSSCHYMLDEAAYSKYNLESINDFIRIHLYATAELPSVKIVPNEIRIKDMQLKKWETRILEFKNQSRHLPIIIRRKRCPFITLNRNKIYLKPLESIEIGVRIDPITIGTNVANLGFDLMYYDLSKTSNKCKVVGEAKVKITFEVVSLTKYPTPQLNLGLTPNYIRDVGKHCHSIKFNTKLNKAKCITVNNVSQLDKTCDDLVAFPNDTQKSLRPCRSPIPHRTIFTKQQRYVAPVESQYELRTSEISRRNEVKGYYTNYRRQQLAIKSKSTSDVVSNANEYDVTMMQKLLCRDVKKCKQLPPATFQKTKKRLFFLPLTAQEMDNILILPPIIKTNPIASYSVYDFQVKIINKNNVPIRVLMCSDKLNLTYEEGNRCVIDKQQELVVNIGYRSACTGYYTSTLYFIVNDSTVLSVPILADVVSHALNIDVTDILLENRNDHKYIELKNNINVDISFYWNIYDGNFIIEPCSGVVNLGKTIVCMVTHHQDLEGPRETVAQLLSGNVNVKAVKIAVKQLSSKLVLLKDLDFSEMPLNEPVRDMFIMKNTQNCLIKYYIKEEDLPQGITVFPLSGNIDPVGEVNIYVTALFRNCFIFKYVLKVYSTNGSMLQVPIKGSVVYPEVVVTPNVINIGKIPASTVTNAQFTVKNVSSATMTIKFDMTEYEEFLISEHPYAWQRQNLTEFKLKSQCTKDLYIHYDPKGASCCSFYLPIVINDILGPPLITDVTSTRTNYYLLEFIDNCPLLPVPYNISCVKVRTLVTPGKVNISKTYLQFKTLPRRKDASAKIKISNPQSVEEHVCIRTDELKAPLYMKGIAGTTETVQDNAIVIHLSPGAFIIFKVTFEPPQYQFGEMEVKLPVYIRSDNSMKEHNVITIVAIYERPRFSIQFSDAKYFKNECGYLSTSYIYSHFPIPLIIKRDRVITLEMTATNHLDDCEVIAEVESSGADYFNWTILKDTKRILDKNGNYTAVIKSTYRDTKAHHAVCICELRCTCGGLSRVASHGTVANGLLTAYIQIEHIRKKDAGFVFHSYPFFPEPDHMYFDFIDECCKCAETWIHTQVLFGLCSYAIPESINFPHLEPPPAQTAARQTQSSRLPILHILGNLLGPEAVAMMKTSEMPIKEVTRMQELYELYEQVIHLIRKQGALLPLIRPEHLFCLSDFFTYYKELYDYSEVPRPQSCTINDEYSFYRFAKQTWLDVVFQIYRAIHLEKLVIKYKSLAEEGKLRETPLHDFFIEPHENIEPEFYSDAESLILSWLQFHYNNGKANVWKKGHYLKNLKVDLHNNTLTDGLVFAVVIVTYCPYFKNNVKDMYLHPNTSEEIYHNILRVIQCLESVNYTFTITPEQIIQGNCIRLFMFSAYLFEILPHMYPTETITLKTGLSTVTVGKMEIFNENNFPIAYKPIFMGCSKGCFTISKDIIEISQRKKVTVSINYFAKFARNMECSLVLSGEVLGYRYASNKCVSLIGEPDLHYASSTIIYEQELFKVEYYDFIIQSPYKTAATYDMQQTYDALVHPLELSSVIYHLDTDRIACARMVALNTTFEFDDVGKCTVHGVVGTFTFITLNIWFYFRNATVGDFAVKFVSVIKDSTQREILRVKIPRQMKRNREVFDTLSLNIPNRNNLFFNTMKSMLIKLSEEAESKFWQKIIETEMGVNILENLFSTTPTDERMSNLIRCRCGEYEVKMSQHANVELPKTIYFEEECSAGFTSVPVVLKNGEYPNDFLLTLDSAETRRRRYYFVSFISNNL